LELNRELEDIDKKFDKQVKVLRKLVKLEKEDGVRASDFPRTKPSKLFEHPFFDDNKVPVAITGGGDARKVLRRANVVSY